MEGTEEEMFDVESQEFCAKERLKTRSWVDDIIVVTICIGIFIPLTFAEPFKRPFDVDDQSISHPRMDDIVPIWWVIIAGFVPPLLVAFLTKNIARFIDFVQRYIVGIAVNEIITNFFKVVAGRLRPDFLDRCQPKDGICTGDPHAIKEGRKSFVSGHASLSFYIVTFFVIWMLQTGWGMLNYKVGRKITSSVVLFLSIIPYFSCLYVSISRYSTY